MNGEEALRVLREQEQLRQDGAAFDHDLRVKDRVSRLQTAMGYASVVVFAAVASACLVVILRHDQYPTGAVGGALAVLAVDVSGLVLAVWRLVLRRDVLQTRAARGRDGSPEPEAAAGAP